MTMKTVFAKNEPSVAHCERSLHDLGRDALREFVLIEVHALAEHQPMEVPAQEHREIAEERLLLDRRLEGDEQYAGGEYAGEQEQPWSFLRPKLRRLDLGDPVEDAAC
jgi:hypothetical protein